MEVEAAERGIRIVAAQPLDSTEFVGAHGGRIWLADSDRGSRFRFSLAPGAASAG